MEPFGNRLREVREEMGLSQQQLADAVGTPRPNISKWETNVYEPDMKTIVALVKTLNTSADYLMGITDV